MTVIRTRLQKEFVCLKNSVLQDPNLSVEAIGLWAHCMSRPENWTFYVSKLADQLKISKKKIYRIINELIENGYVFRYQKKGPQENSPYGQRHLFSSVEYIFYGEKLTEEDKERIEKEINEFQESFSLSHFRHAQLEDAQKAPLQRTDSSSLKDRLEESLKNTEGASPPLPPPSSSEPSKRKKVKEELRKRDERVYTTDTQHQSLLKQSGGDIDLVSKWYAALSHWKISKKIEGGTRDYMGIVDWVIGAVEKKSSQNNTDSNTTDPALNEFQKKNFEENRALAEALKLEFPYKKITIWYKNHVFKCNDPDFDISMLITPSSFMEYIERKMNIRIK